jgi:hypothetical protein
MSFWKFETSLHTPYIQQKLEDFYIYTTVKKQNALHAMDLFRQKMITA